LVDIQPSRNFSLRFLLIAGWIRKSERQRNRPASAAPISLIGSYRRDTNRVKSAAKKDTGLCTINRTRDSPIERCLKSRSGLPWITWVAQIDGRNVPVPPHNSLTVVEIDQGSPRYTVNRLVISFLRVWPAESKMVCQREPVQRTRDTGLRNQS